LARQAPGAGDRSLASPREWADAIPLQGSALVASGAALLAAGVAGAVLAGGGLVGVLVFGGLMTLGGGLAFLGADKARRARREPPGLRFSAVARERGRRIRSVMAATQGQWTHDDLRARLGWTEDAVVEGMLHLRETGQIVEDLDLETGKWVYRLQESDGSTAGSSMTLSLDDRVRRLAEHDPP
jgi:hypothetical protein